MGDTQLITDSEFNYPGTFLGPLYQTGPSGFPSGYSTPDLYGGWEEKRTADTDIDVEQKKNLERRRFYEVLSHGTVSFAFV